MKSIFITCLSAAALIALFNSKVMAFTSEELVEKLAMREQGIKTLKGKFNLKAEYPINIKGKLEKLEKSYEWIVKGQMQKITDEFISFPESLKETRFGSESGGGFGVIETSKHITSFDGETTKDLAVERRQGIIRKGDDLLQRKNPSDWLLLRFGGKSLSAFLKQEGITVAYLGEKKLQEQLCHLLEFSKDQKTTNKLFLSDANGPAPVRFELFEPKIKNSSLPDFKAIYVFSKLRNFGGIWLPQEVVLTVYDVYTDRQEVVMKESFIVNELQVNIDIPQEELFLKLPPGTHVQDSILNSFYTVRE